MIFRKEETLGHLKHLRIKWERIIKRRPEDLFLARFTDLPYRSERYSDYHGNPSICYICGYAMVRVQMDEGWTLDICSAMPALKLNHPLFASWQAGLREHKLPTSCV